MQDEYDWTQQVISATWVVISACTIIVIVAFNQLSVGRVAGRPVLFYAFWLVLDMHLSRIVSLVGAGCCSCSPLVYCCTMALSSRVL